MVLEQKMSENTAGAGQPDLHSAHTKKMSLATKLKKQRRNRQSDSKSPVPADARSSSEAPSSSASMASNSKSPTRSVGKAEDQVVKTKTSEESSTSATSNTTGGSNDTPSKKSSNGGSASLLHNKRRAMNLAKNKKAYQQQKSAVMAAKSETSEEQQQQHKQDKKETQSVTTETHTHDVNPTHSDDSETPCVNAAESDEPELARMEMNATEDTTPEGTALNKDDGSKQENDISERLSQVSLNSSKARSVISNGVVAYDDSIMSIARLDNFRSKANQDKAKKKPAYPGSSGLTEQQNSFESSVSQQSEPVKASQPWKSRSSDTSSVTNKPSWKNSHSSPATVSEEPGSEAPEEQSRAADTADTRRKFSRQPSWVKTRGKQDETPCSPTPSHYSTNTEQRPASPARSTYSSASYGIDRGVSDNLMVPKFSSSRSDTTSQNSAVPMAIRAKTRKPSPSVKSYVPQAVKQEQVCPDSPTTSWPSSGDQQTCPSSPSPSQISEVESEVERAADEHVPKAKTWTAKKQTPSWMNKRNSSPSVMSQQQQEPQPSTPSWVKQKSTTTSETQDTKSATSKLRPAQGVPGRSPPIPKPVNRQNQATDVPEPARSSISSASPRRHSAPWAKPSPGEESETDEKKEATPAPVATAKTWAVNKQTPSWMKKVQGDAEQEEERAPSPVPTTKTFAVKKQTPAWMKQSPVQVDSGDDENKDEQRTAVAPSPRRHSAPTWKKAPGDHDKPKKPVPPSPKTSAWKKPSPVGSDAGKPSSPAHNNKGTWRGRSMSATEQAKSAGSPRRQSWGGSRCPSPSVEKTSVGPTPSWKAKTSENPKVPSSPALPKKQRCPSPSVMQLQNEIFANKLGVLEGGNQEPPQPKTSSEYTKAPASPAPRVVQLQEKIFSPEKEKRQSLGTERMDPKSPAQGWWKRVPNAPQIDTSPHEETVTYEETSQVSSSANGGQTQAPKTGAWKKPMLEANAPGTPSWLKDVAAFHETSSPKLPPQPPVYQQPESSQQLKESDSKSGSFSGKKRIDESSSELMVMSSTSTTSRDDVAMQQEETKSLIQMAADSVLIADYEQAMKRVALESKSYDEDESEHGGAAEPSLPSDLPAEFQEALTAEEDAGGQETSPPLEENKESPAAVEEDQATKIPEEKPQCVETSASPPSSNNGECEKTVSRDNSVKSSPKRQSEDTIGSSEVVFGDPSTYGAAGGDDVPAPRVSDRAKALLGWAETRLQSPQRAEKQSVEIEHVTDNNPGNNSAPEGNSDRNLSSVIYDENGFLCTPFTDENIPVTFENTEFSSRQWIEELDDEKKQPDEPMGYWPVDPLYELNDASASEWANRDPGLDMIPMHSPEPVSTNRKKLTAEMLREHFAAGEEGAPVNAAHDDNWVQVSGGSYHSTKENKVLPQAGPEKTYDSKHTHSEQHRNVTYPKQATTQHVPEQLVTTPEQAPRGNTRANEPQSQPEASHPMWGSEQALDATWGSPDPFAPTSIGHFDRMSSEEKRADARALGDAFDPFGEEDDGFMEFTGGQLFSDPPDAFVPGVMQDDGFDTFYTTLKPVSHDMADI